MTKRQPLFARALFACVVAVFLLAGCHRDTYEGYKINTGETSPVFTPNGTAGNAKEFCFVLTNAPPAIVTFAVDTTSGMLTSVASIRLAWANSTNQQLKTITLNPAGDGLYVTSFTGPYGGDIYGYLVNPSSGALTPAPGFPIAVKIDARSSVIDPSGRFLYLASLDPADFKRGIISAFRIDRKSGALTPIPGSPFEAGNPGGANPIGAMTIDPSGRHLYMAGLAIIANQGSVPAFLSYSIDKNGALTPLADSPVMITGPSSSVGADSVSGVPGDLEQDPSGRFLYVVLGDQVWVFKRDSGNGFLTVTGDSPFRLGPVTEAGIMALEPTGRFAYVATDRGVRGFTIDHETGSVRAMANGPFLSFLDVNPAYVVVDPSGKFLYGPSGSVVAYKIDSDGSLSAIAGSPFHVKSPIPSGLTPRIVEIALMRVK